MNQVTREIMALLKVDADTALKVQAEMDQQGIDYSECTRRELNAAIREAYKTVSAKG